MSALCFLFLAFLFSNPTAEEQITTSPWEIHEEKEGVIDFVTNLHGDPIAYGKMNIPGSKVNGQTTAVAKPTVKDKCGNVYHTVKYGNQVWLEENLQGPDCGKCSKLKKVTLANSPSKNEAVLSHTEPMYAYYGNNKEDKDPHTNKKLGAMFNYAAITSCDICPTGFRVATQKDWEMLKKTVGNTVKLKQRNPENSNKAFAYISGRGDAYGSVKRGNFVEFWTSNSVDEKKATAFVLKASGSSNFSTENNSMFCYVRCVKEEDIPDFTKKDSHWTYGWGKSGGKEFTEFPAAVDYAPGSPVKKRSKSGWWSAAQNTSDKNWTDNRNKVLFPPKSMGAIALHPGKGNNEYAKIRYTAPLSGNYVIQVEFKYLDKDFSKAKAEIWTNSGGSWKQKQELILTKGMYDKNGGVIKEEYSIQLEKGQVVSIELEGAGSFQDDYTLVTLAVDQE